MKIVGLLGPLTLERLPGSLRMARIEQKLARAAEARQLHEEKKALRQSNGGQLTEEQRQQFKQRKQALRQKVKAALQATAPQDV